MFDILPSLSTSSLHAYSACREHSYLNIQNTLIKYQQNKKIIFVLLKVEKWFIIFLAFTDNFKCCFFVFFVLNIFTVSGFPVTDERKGQSSITREVSIYFLTTYPCSYSGWALVLSFLSDQPSIYPDIQRPAMVWISRKSSGFLGLMF